MQQITPAMLDTDAVKAVVVVTKLEPMKVEAAVGAYINALLASGVAEIDHDYIHVNKGPKRPVLIMPLKGK